ncbi:MAG: transposase [bacterium]|nr:transposase [bacterium]
MGESFGGIGVTDDYAAYKTMFSEHQLCWAHLLRKMIKLALQNPDEPAYKKFSMTSVRSTAMLASHAMLAGSRPAKRRSWQLRSLLILPTRRRRSVGGTVATASEVLCTRHEETIVSQATSNQPLTSDSTKTFILLQRKLVGNVDGLFVFVSHPEVELTNNISERNVRREADSQRSPHEQD